MQLFILIIEDRNLAAAGKSERYYTAQNWITPAPVLNYFNTPIEAYKHAMNIFPVDKWRINSITSLGMNSFLSNDDLEENMGLK